MTDSQILTEFAQRRSERAFAEIVRRHGRMVHGVCLRILGRHDMAEEASQAVFLALARKAASVGRKADAGSWLHAVAFLPGVPCSDEPPLASIVTVKAFSLK
jgi:DNA-directed RNA polymerase specialized sigma24 family protein